MYCYDLYCMYNVLINSEVQNMYVYYINKDSYELEQGALIQTRRKRKIYRVIH